MSVNDVELVVNSAGKVGGVQAHADVLPPLDVHQARHELPTTLALDEGKREEGRGRVRREGGGVGGGREEKGGKRVCTRTA